MFGDDPEESDSFVTKDRHDNFVTQEDGVDQEPIGNESEDSHTAYLNALSEFNRQYDLRNRSVGVAPPKRVPSGQTSPSQPVKAQPRKEVVQHKPIEKDVPEAAPPKDKELPEEAVPKEKDLQKEEIKRDLIERYAPPFNLQAEISKVKIAVPFNEIIRIPEYRG